MNAHVRNVHGFVAGGLIGTLGALIGLGGAEFRLPVLVGLFRLDARDALILNKAMSLMVVAGALVFRGATTAPDVLADHVVVAVNLLAGSLIGAWRAAGHAITLPRRWLNRIIRVLLVGLALVMLWEAWAGVHDGGAPLIESGPLRFLAGLVAGLGIGMVAALLGVAGGDLLIPTITLLYGLDIKLAGSLSLMVSLPTMMVGFARYSRSDAFVVLRHERSLILWMVAGSLLGAAAGGLLLGLAPARLLLGVLGIVLLTSAVKIFKHGH